MRACGWSFMTPIQWRSQGPRWQSSNLPGGLEKNELSFSTFQLWNCTWKSARCVKFVFEGAHAPTPIFHPHDDIDVSTRRPFSSLNFQHATGCVTSLPGIFRLATDMAWSEYPSLWPGQLECCLSLAWWRGWRNNPAVASRGGRSLLIDFCGVVLSTAGVRNVRE